MKKYLEPIGITLALLAMNFSIHGFGASAGRFMLLPGKVADGQWWRLFTFAFIHVSPYHLALDGAAFILLTMQLRGDWIKRWTQILICIIASGVTPCILAPEIKQIGLMGLSGVAHGLMLIVALEMASAHTRIEKNFGISMAVGVVIKTLIEQLTGNVLFAQWHLGSVGVPIPSCHLGGLIGGLLSYLLDAQRFGQARGLQLRRKRHPKTNIAASIPRAIIIAIGASREVRGIQP